MVFLGTQHLLHCITQTSNLQLFLESQSSDVQ